MRSAVELAISAAVCVLLLALHVVRPAISPVGVVVAHVFLLTLHAGLLAPKSAVSEHGRVRVVAGGEGGVQGVAALPAAWPGQLGGACFLLPLRRAVAGKPSILLTFFPVILRQLFSLSQPVLLLQQLWLVHLLAALQAAA